MTDTVAQEYFNVAWPLALTESKATGVFPEIIFSQSALETGYGLHRPQNNYFGIKGSGANLSTVEVVKGVAKKVMQHFAGFPSMAGSFQGYANFLRNNRRYKNFRSAGSISAQLVALGTSGYATDPNYAMKIGAIVDLVPGYLDTFNRGSSKVVSPSPIPKVSQTQVSQTRRITPASLATTEDKQTMTDPIANVTGTAGVDLATTKPPHKTGFLADLGHEFDQALTAHKTGLQVAVNLVTQLLPFAPLPAAASMAITDIIGGLDSLAKSPLPATTTQPEQPSPVAAEPVADPIEAAPAIPTALQDAINDGESLLSNLFTDFTSGNFTEARAIADAERLIPTTVQQAEELFNPGLGIKQNPNAN